MNLSTYIQAALNQELCEYEKGIIIAGNPVGGPRYIFICPDVKYNVQNVTCKIRISSHHLHFPPQVNE